MNLQYRNISQLTYADIYFFFFKNCFKYVNKCACLVLYLTKSTFQHIAGNSRYYHMQITQSFSFLQYLCVLKCP